MKKTLLALTLTIAASSAFASNTNDKYTFVASDNSPETQLCMIAAAKGISAARVEAKGLGVNFNKFQKLNTCNGQKLSKFVKSFNAETISEDTAVIAQKVDMRAADGSLESRICVQAAKEGLKATQAEHGQKVSSLKCNKQSLSKFISKYKNKEVM
jgi:hypothetical protein